MTNTQYIEKIFSSVERILVDTSTLMSRGFQQFIINNREWLLTGKKKIVVSKAVYGELVRLEKSEKAEKSESAGEAFKLLNLNKDIFKVENDSLTDEEIAHAFADAQLLAELTLNRSNYAQLLITNDRNLSADAFDLNQQQSCRGRRVLVCYINCFGELQCCDCVHPAAEGAAPKTIRTIGKREARGTTRVSSEKQEDASWKFDWPSGIIVTSGIGIVYALYKGGKAILRHIK